MPSMEMMILFNPLFTVASAFFWIEIMGIGGGGRIYLFFVCIAAHIQKIRIQVWLPLKYRMI
jgi:hypothetical protein